MDGEKKMVLGWGAFFLFFGLITIGIADYSGLMWQSHFGVAHANVERKVFLQSQPYIQGQIQQLAAYHHEYVMADDFGKKAVASTIRHEFADFDASNITDTELRDFLITLRNQ